jgi:hypothetical protein
LKICHDTKEIDTSVVKQNKYGLQPKYVAYFALLLSLRPLSHEATMAAPPRILVALPLAARIFSPATK